MAFRRDDLRINSEYFVLWRAVDSDGYELDVFLQKRKNKKAAICFLTRLLGSYRAPRVIVIDKLRSYIKQIRGMCSESDHRPHKGLNNRVENAHQPTRKKEKITIKFKSPQGVQNTLSLMGKIRNIFAVDVGCYIQNATDQRSAFNQTKSIWDEATQGLLAA